MLFETNGTTKMTLTSSGNLGLGVTPSAWVSTSKGFQIGSNGWASISQQHNGATNIMSNSYESSSNAFTYIASAYALRYNQNLNDGSHAWLTSTISGTAGNAITFTQAMTLNASGQLIIGNTVASNVGLTIYGSNAATIYQTANTGTGAANGFYVGHTGDVSYIWNYNNYPTVFATNNTERMRIFSNGNIGIATTTDAGYKLDVNGTGRFSYLTTSGNNIFNNTGGRAMDCVSDGVLFAKISGAHNIIFGDGAVRYYSLYTPSGAATMSIRNFSTSLDMLTFTSTGAATFSGNVGIKISGRSESLAVEHTTGNVSAGFFYTSGITTGQSYGVTVYAGTNSSDRSFLVSNQGGGTEYFKIRGDGAATFSGDVGIGVTPSAKLDVNGTVYIRTGGILYVDSLRGYTSGTLSTTLSELALSSKFAITGGNVLIGTTTDATGKLQVNGTVYATDFFAKQGANGYISLRSGGSGAAGYMEIYSNNGTTRLGYIGYSTTNILYQAENGASHTFQGGAATFSAGVTATGFYESSDSRLKTLIQDNYQTKGIASITPKLYIKNGKVELGYYAQDFVGILDSAVSKGSDDMLSLSYREVHTAKIYALEQEIKELKAKMN
jgi:hypothetical protein